MRLDQIGEAIDDLFVDTADLCLQFERLFGVLAKEAGLEVPPARTASGFGRRGGIPAAIRSLAQRLKKAVQKRYVRLRVQTAPGSRVAEDSKPLRLEPPPGCVVRDLSAIGRIRVVLLGPATDGSRAEDFLLLARRFKSSSELDFVVASEYDDRLRRLAKMFRLDNVILPTRASDLPQKIAIACAMSEVALPSQWSAIAHETRFLLATRESALAVEDCETRVDYLDVGDIAGFERVLRDIVMARQVTR